MHALDTVIVGSLLFLKGLFSFRLHLYKCSSCSQMEKQPQRKSNDVLAREFTHSLGKGFSAYRYLTS